MVGPFLTATFEQKQNCCGCGACDSVCPKQCITMTADQEGFLYPEINSALCVNCGKCEKVCPVINSEPDIPFEQKAYIVQLLDETERKQSTSGGAFTAIAKWTLRQDGVVFGAAFDENLHVHHVGVENEDELWRFRNSKYVQSEIGDAFRQAREYLDAGRMVCFSGTPCQIEGLLNYVGNNRKNLVTVDVVCHALPSPLVFEKYLDMQREKYGELSNVIFREKHYGYKYSTMTLIGKDGKQKCALGVESDPYLRAFFGNVCDRPSCYACRFKKRYRRSDLTIWDCFTVYRYDRSFDDDLGTTSILTHNEKGNDLLVAASAEVHLKEVSPDMLTTNAKEMIESIPVHPGRTSFMFDASEFSGKSLFDKYFPVNFKTILKKNIRLTLVRTNLYCYAKRIVMRVKGR